MKFAVGDNVDALHCLAIKHEYLRCRDAFELFREAAEGIIMLGHDRDAAYRAYNAYSSFILHLYEFLIALHARDYGDTEVVSLKAAKAEGVERHDVLDALVNEDAHKVVQARIDRITSGRAPRHENSLDYYTKLLPVPSSFAETLRRTRNIIGAHVSYKRVGVFDLTAFYRTYHPYLYLLFRDIGDYWGQRSDVIPDLANVTDFFKAIREAQDAPKEQGPSEP
jgi:hypothetical protein